MCLPVKPWPCSGVDALLAGSGIGLPIICPLAPPIEPATVFPSVSRSIFLAAPPATLPPEA